MFLFDPTNVMLGQFSIWHPNTNEDNDVEDNKTGWVFTENNEHSFWFKRPLMFLFDPNIVMLGQFSSWHPNTNDVDGSTIAENNDTSWAYTEL